jgi:hypothetical protein
LALVPNRLGATVSLGAPAERSFYGFYPAFTHPASTTGRGFLSNKSAVTVLAHWGQLTRANADAAMCDKCNEIDEKIERYRRFTHAVADQDFVDRLNALIRDLEREKIALHPKE